MSDSITYSGSGETKKNYGIFRNKKYVKDKLIYNLKLALGSAVCGLKYCFGCGSCDGGLTQVPHSTIRSLQIGFKTVSKLV